MAEATVDVDSLYAALERKRHSKNLSWRDLAAQLDISPSTFSRMAQGGRPDVDAYATLLRWLGMPSEAFVQSSTSRRERPDPVAMISSYLRSAPQIRAEDADALEDIIAAAYRRIVRDR